MAAGATLSVAPQVAAACGPEFTLENMALIGERIWNLERDFNNRAGFTAADDTLPKRLLTEGAKTGPAKGLASKLPESVPARDVAPVLRRARLEPRRHHQARNPRQAGALIANGRLHG